MTNRKLFLILASLFLVTSEGARSDTPSVVTDPFFVKQWSLNNDGTQFVDINFDDFHTINQKGTPGVDIGWLAAKKQVVAMAKNPVIVGILDSGLDTNHPDLVGRVLPGGWDFLDNNGKVTDPVGHGTGLAGIIAANIDNGVGISGITPGSVKILSLRVFSNDFSNFRYKGTGKLISDYVADGITYAVAHGATILNLSMIWPKLAETDNIKKAIQNAQKAGVLLIAAAGNEKRDHVTFPCAYEGVLCVGAVTNNGEMALYSNYGGMVDVLAPGDDIISLFPTNLQSPFLRIKGYEDDTGTSDAAPMVTGIAAVLKSIYPAITSSEIKARILGTASQPPSANASLYGLVNLNRAINAKAMPVYLPMFKSLEDAIVDENTLTVKSSVDLENLWIPASNVKVQVLINGKMAGSIQTKSLSANSKLSVPWTYKFQSLDDSATLRLTLKVSDDSGNAKEFSYDSTATRALENMPASSKILLSNVKADDWFGKNNDHMYSKISAVDSYPFENGVQRYYQQTKADAQGATVTIFDPISLKGITSVQVPAVQTVRQVIRIDMKGDGQRDWVITGQGKTATGQDFFQFYFLSPSFQPLWENSLSSTWQIFDGGGQNIIRNFSTPGAWIQLNGNLVPSFVGKGMLPSGDNFRELDSRFFAVENHLYYLAPQAPVGSNPAVLKIHAVDNAVFRAKYPGIFVENMIPTSVAEMAKGQLRLLVQMGTSLSSAVEVWNLKSVSDFNLQPVSGWDAFSANGSVYWAQSPVTSQNLSVFSGMVDDHRGSLAWASPQGQFIDRSEYTYSSAVNPIINLSGAFDFGSLGRYWFVETGFDLVGFHEDQNHNVTSQNITLERDSSWPTSQFSQIMTPVVAGGVQNPLPGILYIDSNLVRKNEIFLTDWNIKINSLERSLRYSLRIPDACLVMNAIRTDSQVNPQGRLLAFPMLCQQGTAVNFRVITP